MSAHLLKQKHIVVLFLGLLIFLASVAPQPAHALSSDIVISQVYGGGGNSGATLKNDFIELYNRGASAVNITGWSVQYASAAGNSWAKTNLVGTIQPGMYYLIQEAAGAGGTQNLPPPDATGTLAMSATNGKVALVINQTLLACGAATNDCFPNANIRDFVGYGTANNYETTAVPALTNTTAALRKNNGATETDNNNNDFSTGTPNPRNSFYPNPYGAGLATPNSMSPGDTTLLTVTVIPGSNPMSTGLAVTSDLTSIGGSATQTFYDDATHGDATAGDNIFSFQATVSVSTTLGAKTLPVTVSDAQARSSSTSIALAVFSTMHIRDVQGATHLSPFDGYPVTLFASIVTAKRSNGFYLQDPSPDANDATSEGVFVFTSSAPAVSVGDLITVTGTVQEYRPSADPTYLTITEIISPSISVQSTGNALPAPIVIGNGGRVPPTMVIEDDSTTGNVETNNIFDPANDGLDFYESLEGMLVQVNNAVVVGPTNSFGEVWVLGDNGANASVRTGRGGIVIRSNDFNPERILLDKAIASLPTVNVSDTLSSPIVGVMDYGFGNYRIQVTQAVTATSGGLAQETTAAPTTKQLTVATFNVENLNPADPASKFSTLADLIVNHLQSPDLIAVEEIQDNSGATNDGTVDASTTYSMLLTAITTAGGPTYDYRQIDPVNNQDGGAPGGNIRQAFLFRTDRGLAFVDRVGAGSTTANSVINNSGVPQLQYSPGRIDPTNTAFNSSRKPLAGEFLWKGRRFFVIANHFNSKGGDQPLFGVNQPPVLSSETQRLQQAQIVRDFVANILAIQASADVIVLGDLNDFEFSNPLATLKSAPLTALIETLPQNERYTYVYEGNSQAIDQVLVSSDLFRNWLVSYDVVHVNSEFATQVSDHEPSVVRFDFTRYLYLPMIVR